MNKVRFVDKALKFNVKLKILIFFLCIICIFPRKKGKAEFGRYLLYNSREFVLQRILPDLAQCLQKQFEIGVDNEWAI